MYSRRLGWTSRWECRNYERGERDFGYCTRKKPRGKFENPGRLEGENKNKRTQEENVFCIQVRGNWPFVNIQYILTFVREMGGEWFVLGLLCLAVIVRSQQETYDYCDPKLKLCEVATDHTMCKYPMPGLSSQCTPGAQEPLNSTEKDRILFLHNKFRSYIAEGTDKNKIRKLPQASNMRQMYWDKELENIAARWAEQCIKTTSRLVYDKCRNTKRFQVSQNVGTRRVNGSTIDKQAPQIVITWYKESKDFDPSLVEKFSPDEDVKMSVKQFANIIWAETYAVGCARIIFQEQMPTSDKDLKLSVWMTERLVCNYGPGGSEIGKPIYKRGTPCENCPAGTKCSTVFPGLCATQSSEKAKDTKETKEDAKDDTKGYKSEPTTVGLEEEEEEKILMTGQKKDPSDGECIGEECISEEASDSETPPPLNEIMKNPRPTARRKVGFEVADDGDDIVIEKLKWTNVNSTKVRREAALEERMKYGDRCKCYIATEENGSSRMKLNIFLLLFSVFIKWNFLL